MNVKNQPTCEFFKKTSQAIKYLLYSAMLVSSKEALKITVTSYSITLLIREKKSIVKTGGILR